MRITASNHYYVLLTYLLTPRPYGPLRALAYLITTPVLPYQLPTLAIS